MKATISKDGQLTVIAENECEAFALGIWNREVKAITSKYTLSVDIESFNKVAAVGTSKP